MYLEKASKKSESFFHKIRALLPDSGNWVSLHFWTQLYHSNTSHGQFINVKLTGIDGIEQFLVSQFCEQGNVHTVLKSIIVFIYFDGRRMELHNKIYMILKIWMTKSEKLDIRVSILLSEFYF